MRGVPAVQPLVKSPKNDMAQLIDRIEDVPDQGLVILEGPAKSKSWGIPPLAPLPHYLQIRDNCPMVFAGLWESWKAPEGEAVESCTILTTAANNLVEPVHDRMPVIL